jgi:hypothetical protein
MELDVDTELRDRLASRAEQVGFESTEAYAEMVLAVVVDELESGEQNSDRSEEVRDRLEDLGYL